EEGVDAAVSRLFDAGVRVSLAEFKQRSTAFDNPLLRTVYVGATGGSRGTRRRAEIGIDYLRHTTAYQSLFLDAFEARNRPLVLWRPVPPGRSGLHSALRALKVGAPAEAWYTQERLRLRASTVRDWPVTW